MPITRRDLGTAAAAATGGLLARPALAQQRTLTILSHRVHENVARGAATSTTGGDIAGEWADRNNVTLQWTTAAIDPMHERLQRELALRETSIDVALIINKFSTPRLSRLLEPLDAHQSREPIEALDEISAGMLNAVRTGDRVAGIPYRHATTGLHYNEAIFRERGVETPPKTLEGVLDAARRLTFTRPNGVRVHGLTVPSAAGPFAVLSFLSAFGAELVGQDLKVHAGEPAMVRALTMMRDLFKEGVLPPTYASLNNDDVISDVQQGRAAMSLDPFARFVTHNDPRVSLFPGAIKVTPIPSGPDTGRAIVAMTEIWSFVIPRNSTQKTLAWEFIRELSSRENTVRAALNGNGPVRPSAYVDPRVQKAMPYTQEEAMAVREAITIPSSFNASAQTGNIFMEESQAAILGLKAPDRAAADLQRRIEPLVRQG